MENKLFGYMTGKKFVAIRQAQSDEQAARLEKILRFDKDPEEARWIEVRDIEQARYIARQSRNPRAQPITLNQQFNSAADASRHMGYGYNEVAIRMAAAKRNGKDEVTICGVTFTPYREH